MAGSVSADRVVYSTIDDSFNLTAHTGKEFEFDSLKGKVALLYFGFTYCPSICPMELTHISQALDALPDDKVIGLFITVDPERDTVQKLSTYAPFFHARIIGLTGANKEIDKAAKLFNVSYRRIAQGDSYTFDHSSNIIVLNQLGEVKALVPFGSNYEHLVKLVQGVLSDNS